MQKKNNFYFEAFDEALVKIDRGHLLHHRLQIKETRVEKEVIKRANCHSRIRPNVTIENCNSITCLI